MSGPHSAGKGDRSRVKSAERFAANYSAINWSRAEYRLIWNEHDRWYVIRADEVPVFYRWCDAMAGRGEHVPRDFTPVPVSGPGGVVFREWREVRDHS